MHEQFHWTAPNGSEIVLPRSDKIKAGVLRKVRHMDEMDAVFTIFEQTVDEATMALIDDLTIEELGNLAEAWQKDEVSLGEASGSSGSSTTTVEPSSSTSEPASPESVAV